MGGGKGGSALPPGGLKEYEYISIIQYDESPNVQVH
jgi:hypothetical protein